MSIFPLSIFAVNFSKRIKNDKNLWEHKKAPIDISMSIGAIFIAVPPYIRLISQPKLTILADILNVDIRLCLIKSVIILFQQKNSWASSQKLSAPIFTTYRLSEAKCFFAFSQSSFLTN